MSSWIYWTILWISRSMFVQVVQWRKWTWPLWASKEFIRTEIRSKMSLWDWVRRTKLWKNYSLSNNSVRTTPMRERRTVSNSSKSRIFLRLYRQFYRWVLTVKVKSNCFFIQCVKSSLSDCWLSSHINLINFEVITWYV